MNQQSAEILLGTFLQLITIFFVTKLMHKNCLEINRLRDEVSYTKFTDKLVRFQLALIIGFIVWMAFLDHMIHRAGRFLKESGSAWELWRGNLPYDFWFMNFIMAVAMAPLLYLLYITLQEWFPESRKPTFREKVKPLGVLALLALIGIGVIALARYTA
jgi:hypothetical protein